MKSLWWDLWISSTALFHFKEDAKFQRGYIRIHKCLIHSLEVTGFLNLFIVRTFDVALSSSEHWVPSQ
jgi:hypothetical protein